MLRELAQAIHELANNGGRLSEESKENIAFLLEGEPPVSDVSVTASDDDSKSTPSKSTSTPSKSAASKSGGSKS